MWVWVGRKPGGKHVLVGNQAPAYKVRALGLLLSASLADCPQAWAGTGRNEESQTPAPTSAAPPGKEVVPFTFALYLLLLSLAQ